MLFQFMTHTKIKRKIATIVKAGAKKTNLWGP